MKIGFSTLGCPSWDLATVVAQAKAMGYDGIELRGLAGQLYLPAVADLNADPPAVRAALEEAGVEVVCLGTSASFHWPDKQKLADQKAEVREYIELASRLGCPFVRVFGDEVPLGGSRERTLGQIGRVLTELAEVAAEYRVTILLENHGDFGGSRDLWYVMDATSHPGVQSCWDPCYAATLRERPTLSIPRLGTRIALVHVCDGKFGDDGRLEAYALPGEGRVELSRMIELLRGVGYRGYLIFEWPKLWVATLAEPDKALPAALATVKKWVDHRDPVLTAYKADKNAPKLASPAGRPPARTRT